MPFVVSAVHYPAAGKAADIAAQADERLKGLHAKGIEANLTVVLFGPEYPAYRISQRFATLADYEQARRAGADATRQFNASIAPLVRQPGMLALFETLLQTNQSSAPVRWIQVDVSAPALGKSLEARAILLELGKQYEAEGLRTTVNLQVAGPESGVFVQLFSYGSLPELEAQRTRAAADTTHHARMLKLNALLSRPIETSIRETLIEYPQR